MMMIIVIIEEKGTRLLALSADIYVEEEEDSLYYK